MEHTSEPPAFDSSVSDEPMSENPVLDEPVSEGTTQLNTNISNTKELNTDVIKYPSINNGQNNKFNSKRWMERYNENKSLVKDSIDYEYYACIMTKVLSKILLI